MKVIEYGAENSDVIMLLHGGGLAAWNYSDAAELLKDRYRVVIPVLDGHSGSDRDFTTIEENARELIGYIDESFGGSVLMLGGLSLGGQILVEMLSQRKDICGHALVESALVLPMKLTAKLIKPAFSACYPLVKKRWFAKLQFDSLHMKPKYFDEYFRDSAAISKENLTAFLTANSDYRLKDTISDCRAKTLMIVGGRESGVMKRSALLLNERIPGSDCMVLDGYFHGDLSLNHPELYAEKILALLADSRACKQ